MYAIRSYYDDIYYDAKTGTLAASYFYKDLAGKAGFKYIELNRNNFV